MAKLCAVCNKKTSIFDEVYKQGVRIHGSCTPEFDKDPEKYGVTAIKRKEPEIAQEFEPPSPSTPITGKGVILGLLAALLAFVLIMFITEGATEPFGPTGMAYIIAGVISGVVGIVVANSVTSSFEDTAISLVTAAKKSTRKAVEINREADKRVGVKKEIKTEEDAYERAAEELEQETQNKGIWAKAFADADGDLKKQKALYIRYRAEQLIKKIVE